MPYTQTTLTQLRKQLEAKWESVPFWTTAEEDFAINEALQWYNLYTGLWKRRVTFPTVTNQTWYTTPSTLVFNARVEFNGTPLAMSSLADLDNNRPGWEGETTASGGTVPAQPATWAPLGLTRLAIWPADATGQNSLLIDGVHTTPVLVTGTDRIDIDASEIDDILGEALYISCFKDPGRFPRVADWHTTFLQTAISHNGRLKASNAFRKAAGLDGQRQHLPLSLGIPNDGQ